jgi:hypothetical protein
MNEADLELLLASASRRIRAQRAIRMSLLVLAFSILGASLLILWARINPQYQWLIAIAMAVPPVGATLSLIISFIRYIPRLQTVALTVDRHAHSDEHLVTWLDLRGRNDGDLEPLRRDFRDAQRTATLQKAATFQVSRLLPLRLPDWSRAILLAVLLMCCALLVPPKNLAARNAAGPAKDEGADLADSSGGGGGSGGEKKPRNPNVPSVVINVSHEEMDKWRLLAQFDGNKEMQLQALKDARAKLGNIPLSQLPDNVRDLLSQLERKTGSAEKSEDKSAGNVQRTGPANPGEDPSGKIPGGAVIIADYNNEKAFSAVRDKFSDVEVQLERYYRGPVSAAKVQK